jgi:hypothetical protein
MAAKAERSFKIITDKTKSAMRAPMMDAGLIN